MLSEDDVLKPLDPSVRAGDTDKWPEFSLTHVRVLSQATHEPVSLLAAHGGFLVRVEGYLEEVEAVNSKLLVTPTPDYRSKWIAIPNVATYSFAVFEDGTFGFWAAGKAGWFEVASPSQSYAQIFLGMKEATGMFYYLADKFRKSGNKFNNAPQKRISSHVNYHFDQYQNSEYCLRADIVNSKRAFYHHREFLMKSMLEGHEGLHWEVSPILRHLQKKFPNDFAVIKSIVQVARKGAGTNQGIVLADVDNEGGASEVDEEDEAQPAFTSENPAKRKKASILRPKSNKAAKKYASRRRGSRSSDSKQLARVKLEEDTDTDPNEESGTESTDADGTVLGDTPDDDAQDDDPQDDDAEVNDAPVVAPAIPLNSQPSSTIVQPLPRAVKAPSKTPKVVLWADDINNPIPSYYQSCDSADTWTCPYQKCSYRVWEASEAESIEMIKEHFVETHASSAEDLVYEERRPWVSVDHLMQKIKSTASPAHRGVIRSRY